MGLTPMTMKVMLTGGKIMVGATTQNEVSFTPIFWSRFSILLGWDGFVHGSVQPRASAEGVQKVVNNHCTMEAGKTK